MTKNNNFTWEPCPFCGTELIEFGRGIRNGKVVEQRVHPYSGDCVLGFGIVVDRARWNKRIYKKDETKQASN